MTKAELIEKAKAMGLGTDESLGGMTNAQLNALIEANAEAGTQVQGKGATNAASEDRGDDPRTGKKIKVIIEFGDGDLGKAPVFAGVNGYTIEAPRGKEVDMDSGFVKYLKSLRVEQQVTDFDKDGKVVGSHTESKAKYNITEVE